MTEPHETSSASNRVRKDGRRSLLIYLPPEMVRDLKKAALEKGCHVYEIAEEAFAAWLSDAKARGDRT